MSFRKSTRVLLAVGALLLAAGAMTEAGPLVIKHAHHAYHAAVQNVEDHLGMAAAP